MTNPDPFQARAASILRETPDPGWAAISDRVMSAVRATPRHGWPLHAAPVPGDDAPGSVHVSDQALRAILARELRRRYVCRPTAIAFTYDERDDRRLRGVHLDITGSYGTELLALGEQIRAAVAQLVDDVLGPHESVDQQPIDVTITDVVTGDPLNSE